MILTQLEFDFGIELPKVKETDNEKIERLQEAFLADRENDEVKTELWMSITACAKRMIFCERKKKGFWLSPDEMDFKATSCTEYIFYQYATRPNFKMKTPSSYIFLRVLASLYRHKKLEEYLLYTDKEM